MNDPLLWARARDLMFAVEGGLSEHPDDPGGVTKYGISQRAHPDVDVRNLTREQATIIMRDHYWDPLPRGLPPDVRWFAFDSCFHSGMQRALAWAEAPSRAYEAFAPLPLMVARRLAFLANLSTWPVFGRGWTNRIARVLDAIARHEAEVGRVRARETVVLTDWSWLDRLRGVYQDPIVARGHFVVRERDGRLDVRRE